MPRGSHVQGGGASLQLSIERETLLWLVSAQLWQRLLLPASWGAWLPKMTLRPYQRFVSQRGSALFFLLPWVSVGSCDDSRRFSWGFIAQSMTMDTFSFSKNYSFGF